MSVNLKVKEGYKAFSNEQASLLGYVKAPDDWVRIVYRFPLRLRLKSFFYRLWVRIRYGLKSGEMWWSGDEPDIDLGDSLPIGWTGDAPLPVEPLVPCIGTPPEAPKDLGMPGFDPELCREQERQLQRYMDIARKFQSERPTKRGGPEERPNPHRRD